MLLVAIFPAGAFGLVPLFPGRGGNLLEFICLAGLDMTDLLRKISRLLRHRMFANKH